MLCGRGLLGLRILVLGLVGLVFLLDWPHWGECKDDLKELDKEACSASKDLGFSVLQAVRGLFVSKVNLRVNWQAPAFTKERNLAA